MKIKISLCFFLFLVKTNFCQVFENFNVGQKFTSITVDNEKNVWAGTIQKGLFVFYNGAASRMFFHSESELDNLNIKSLAVDTSGDLYIGSSGINSGIREASSNALGGVYKKSGFNKPKRYIPDYDDCTEKNLYKNDGLATRNVSAVTIDRFGTVWVAQKYTDLTVTGLNSSYTLTPGNLSYKAYRTDKFITDNQYSDYYRKTRLLLNGETPIYDNGMPYPTTSCDKCCSGGAPYTAGTRNVYAVATDSTHVYISVNGYSGRSSQDAKEPGELYPIRIVEYILGGNGWPVGQYYKSSTTLLEMGFKNNFGYINNIYSNNTKGLWVTHNLDEGFSVKKEGVWHYIDKALFPNILPIGIKFNNNAIWGNEFGNVFIGTNKGLIVYDGRGDVDDETSYTLYTMESHNLISNNIICGTSEKTSSNFQWIATDNGIMKFTLSNDMTIYHVNNKDEPFKEKINNNNNYEKMTELPSTYPKIQYGSEVVKEVPSFAVDGTTSSVLRLKTDDPSGYYATNSLYKIELRKNILHTLPGNPNSQEYIDRYGKLTLKPLTDYRGQPQVQDLKFVDFIYEHPKYIEENDFVSNKHYAEYQFVVFKKNMQISDSIKFVHPIRLCLPPVLFGHGVWSNVNSMQKFENYFINEGGYSEYEVAKAWRLDEQMAENHFYRDAHIIPTYIKDLIRKALGTKVSAGKVNVIVHSRGGLYTRAYIEEIRSGIKYNNDINALVTLNTPHFGSQAANGILDKRVLLTGINKTFSVIPSKTLYNLAQEIQYGPSEPTRIGDIFGLAAPHDKENNYGAKNLIVENDYLSGGLDASTWFIPRLNSLEYRKKFSGIPFHAVATNFSMCELHPSLCKNEISLSTPIYFPKNLLWVKLLYEVSKYFILNTAPENLDDFLNYVYNGSSDGIVPRASMRANLDDKFISSFSGQNILHIDAKIGSLNMSGVAANELVHSKVFDLLRQNFDAQDSNFTKEGIKNYTSLNYNFLAGFEGQQLRRNSKTIVENNSKIVINPESFSSTLISGTSTTFDVYQEDVNKIIIYIESDDLENNVLFYEKNINIDFKNTFILDIPNDMSGKINIKALGYKDGKLVAEHSIEKIISLPSSITLQSIRFQDSKITISEKNRHRFKLLGLYSDNVERKINELKEINYTIDNNLVIEKLDNQTIKTNVPGQSRLIAKVGDLNAEIEYDVVEDISLKETIISDYNSEYQQTGSILLKWNTLLEYNTSKFVLEKSLDNINYFKINDQNAKGLSYDILEYNFTDDTNEKKIYYKLKVLDVFNNIVFEEVLSINRDNLSTNEDNINNTINDMEVFPNPTKGNSFSIKFKKDFSKANLFIYNLNGSEVHSIKNIESTNSKILINLPFKLIDGVYFIKVKTDEFIKTKKLVVKN